jgi:hypothetical protein
MQQPCQQCGYVSDRPARFCRQCGAQLFVENEATSATTRQYAPQQTANPYDAPYQSQLAPGIRFEGQTPDTSRLYNAPPARNYPDYPANYQYSAPKKSGALKWVLITLLCIALVSGGVGWLAFSAMNRAQQRAAEVLPSAEEIERQIRDRIQEEIDRAMRDAERAARDAERAAENGAPAPHSPPPGAAPSGLERYKYPNAVVDEPVKAFGNEVIKMTTSDSIGKVRDFYKKQVGDPMFKDEDGEKVIFNVPGSPMILITISQSDEDPDKTQIVVFRASLKIPGIN